MATSSAPTKPQWGPILKRGFTKRCPRCGSRKLFTGWFRLKEHCPRCGMRFERENGAFTGVYLLNFGVVLFLLWALMMVYVALLATSEGEPVDLAPIVAAGVVITIVFPVVFYPLATTIWIALHLGSADLSPAEQEEAEAHRTVPRDELELASS